MPFLEVFDFDATPDMRRTAAERMTQSLCSAYDIAPDIICTYFFNVDGDSYAHGAAYGKAARIKRLFIKVHAFARPVQLRRQAARMLTDAVAAAYGVPEDTVAIYFFDRARDEAAHAGVLSSESP